ncbi:hypothetical protein KQL63_002203 [Escherichia coli]|nr:hypothetical protein [Escherichia coli]
MSMIAAIRLVGKAISQAVGFCLIYAVGGILLKNPQARIYQALRIKKALFFPPWIIQPQAVLWFFPVFAG